MMAVTNGHCEVAQLLVDHGAHVDCTDKHLNTALHRAVSTCIVLPNELTPLKWERPVMNIHIQNMYVVGL